MVAMGSRSLSKQGPSHMHAPRRGGSAREPVGRDHRRVSSTYSVWVFMERLPRQRKQPNRQKNLRGTLSRSWTGTGLLGKLQKPIHGSGCFPACHWEKPALREHEWPFHRRI